MYKGSDPKVAAVTSTLAARSLAIRLQVGTAAKRRPREEELSAERVIRAREFPARCPLSEVLRAEVS